MDFAVAEDDEAGVAETMEARDVNFILSYRSFG